MRHMRRPVVNFTESEIIVLERAGWDDIKDNRAYDGWHRIIKRDDSHFELQAFMDDGEGAGWWMFDSGYPTLEKALVGRKCA